MSDNIYYPKDREESTFHPPSFDRKVKIGDVFKEWRKQIYDYHKNLNVNFYDDTSYSKIEYMIKNRLHEIYRYRMPKVDVTCGPALDPKIMNVTVTFRYKECV